MRTTLREQRPLSEPAREEGLAPEARPARTSPPRLIHARPRLGVERAPAGRKRTNYAKRQPAIKSARGGAAITC